MQNTYCEADNHTVIDSDNEQEDFNIELDVSDADLLVLKQELNRVRSETIQRELADATVALQEKALKRWKRCVSNHLLLAMP